MLAAVATFFALLLVFIASPFVMQAAPVDGNGLNPSLQNPYMLAPTALLYLGYVGLTIPFAFAMAALASRVTDERWIVATRRWTLMAWTFLGVGILSAPSGRTRRSAGAAGTPGIPSRTPRSCRGSWRRRSCTP